MKDIFLRILLALICAVITTAGWLLIQYDQSIEFTKFLEQHSILYIYIFSSNFALAAILSLVFLYQSRQAEYASILDQQTKLYNRRYFFKRLQEEWNVVQRSGGNLCLLCFDLDNFKNINKTYSESVGDAIIAKVADIARDSMRQEDIIARVSGVEYALILPRCEVQHGQLLAERIRQGIKDMLLPVGVYASIRVTATFGISVYAEQQDYHQLMRQAQEAIYRGKKQGRDCIVTFTDSC